MNQKEIKPCPFCGEDAARSCEIPSKDNYCFVVRCDWCGVQTAPRNNTVIPWDDWNRRPQRDENKVKTPGFDHLSYGWHYEDQLPSNYPYNWGYKRSEIVDGVRMFPPHKCYFIRSLDGSTEICECGAWR